MSRRPESDPEEDDDDAAFDVPQPEIRSDIDDNGDTTITVTFPSGAQYSATADDEAAAGVMLGIGLASIAEREDAPADLAMWAGVIGVAFDAIAEAEAERGED